MASAAILRAGLLAPTAATLAGMFGSTLAILLVVERQHWRHLRSRTLLQRWWSWLIIAAVYALAVLSGAIPMLLLVALLVAQGLREYGALVGLPRAYTAVMIVAGVAIEPVALSSPHAYLALLPVLLIGATLQPLLTQDSQAGARHLAFVLLGFGYLPLLLGHVLLIYAWIPGGPGLLLALGLAVALSDVGAFLAGRRFGRRKLAPRLSPNKTWAGIGGNVAGAYLGVALMQFALPPEPSAGKVLLLATLPLVVALGAVWGDLLESLFKREFGVKDSAAWLPGMGGLLDRMDSLLFVVPLAYYYLRFLTWTGHGPVL
jgi:phosphatidate cytidylyltransferase